MNLLLEATTIASMRSMKQYHSELSTLQHPLCVPTYSVSNVRTKVGWEFPSA
jgi:hypothetical protein